MARGRAPDRARGLREAGEEGSRRALGDLRRARRVRALLRVDRRAVQPAGRPVLPPAHHPAAGEKRLVAEERGRGGGADRRGPDAARRAGGGGGGEGRRGGGGGLRGL